jgi:signal transduction histidine kinase
MAWPKARGHKLSTIVSGLGLAMLLSLTVAVVMAIVAGDEIAIGGPLYGRIAAGKDLIADILPPPENLIEAYLEVNLALQEPDRLAGHVERLKRLHADYDRRRDYWRQQPDIPEELKLRLVAQSDAFVARFWDELEQRFLPSLAEGDNEAVSAAYMALSAAYKAHQAVITELVEATSQANLRVERRAAAREKTLLIANGLAFCVAFILLVASLLVVKLGFADPLSRITQTMGRLSKGELDNEIPFAERRDEIGDMARALAVFRDTAREKLILAEESERFSEVLAHHIQEPVRQQLIQADLLKRRIKELAQTDELEEIGRVMAGAQRLRQLIADVQIYLSLRPLPPPDHPCSVDTAVAAALQRLQPELLAAGGVVDLAETLPSLAVDPLRLAKIFRHLIDNAVKYRSPDRPLHIRVDWHRSDGHAVVHVTDNGIGIAPAYRQRVFQVFERLSGYGSGGGTGIGLAIVRKIAVQVGGDAWIEDGEAGGCRVCVTLPLVKPV